MKVIDVTCDNVNQALWFLNHNTDVFHRRIRRLERWNRSHVLVGIIFGVAIGFRIDMLEEKLGRLDAEVRKLSGEKGD